MLYLTANGGNKTYGSVILDEYHYGHVLYNSFNTILPITATQF